MSAYFGSKIGRNLSEMEVAEVSGGRRVSTEITSWYTNADGTRGPDMCDAPDYMYID